GNRPLLPRQRGDHGGHLPREPGDRRHRVLQVRPFGRALGEAHLRRVHEARGVEQAAPAEAARRAGTSMKTVEIVERGSLLEGLYGQLELKASETAIVTIDMHRGH